MRITFKECAQQLKTDWDAEKNREKVDSGRLKKRLRLFLVAPFLFHLLANKNTTHKKTH